MALLAESSWQCESKMHSIEHMMGAPFSKLLFSQKNRARTKKFTHGACTRLSHGACTRLSCSLHHSSLLFSIPARPTRTFLCNTPTQPPSGARTSCRKTQVQQKKTRRVSTTRASGKAGMLELTTKGWHRPTSSKKQNTQDTHAGRLTAAGHVHIAMGDITSGQVLTIKRCLPRYTCLRHLKGWTGEGEGANTNRAAGTDGHGSRPQRFQPRLKGRRRRHSRPKGTEPPSLAATFAGARLVVPIGLTTPAFLRAERGTLFLSGRRPRRSRRGCARGRCAALRFRERRVLRSAQRRTEWST